MSSLWSLTLNTVLIPLQSWSTALFNSGLKVFLARSVNWCYGAFAATADNTPLHSFESSTPELMFDLCSTTSSSFHGRMSFTTLCFCCLLWERSRVGLHSDLGCPEHWASRSAIVMLSKNCTAAFQPLCSLGEFVFHTSDGFLGCSGPATRRVKPSEDIFVSHCVRQVFVNIARYNCLIVPARAFRLVSYSRFESKYRFGLMLLNRDFGNSCFCSGHVTDNNK